VNNALEPTEVARTARRLKEAGEALKLLARLRADPQAYAELLAPVAALQAALKEADLARLEAGLRAALAEVEAEMGERAQRFRQAFGRALAERLEPRGLALRGQFPELGAGPLAVVLDLPRKKARLDFGPDEVASVAPTVEAVAGAVLGFLDELNGRPLDAPAFLRELLGAWGRACRVAGQPGGARLPILAVYLDLVLARQPARFRVDPSPRTFVAYPRHAFAWDLLRLRRSRGLSVDGRRLVLHTAVYDETRHREDYLWVPDDEQGTGTRISHLSFQAEEA
jgi:hypothetical protein